MVALEARVHREALHRKAVVDVDETVELVLGGPAEASLHRNRDWKVRAEDLVEKADHGLGLAQKARTLALGDDCARGTAEVEVHLVVAHIGKPSRHPEEIGRAARQKLRNRMNARIGLGRELAHLAVRELRQGRGRHERNEPVVRAREVAAENLPEDEAREALHGGDGKRRNDRGGHVGLLWKKDWKWMRG